MKKKEEIAETLNRKKNFPSEFSPVPLHLRHSPSRSRAADNAMDDWKPAFC